MFVNPKKRHVRLNLSQAGVFISHSYLLASLLCPCLTEGHCCPLSYGGQNSLCHFSLLELLVPCILRVLSSTYRSDSSTLLCVYCHYVILGHHYVCFSRFLPLNHFPGCNKSDVSKPCQCHSPMCKAFKCLVGRDNL